MYVFSNLLSSHLCDDVEKYVGMALFLISNVLLLRQEWFWTEYPVYIVVQITSIMVEILVTLYVYLLVFLCTGEAAYDR